MAKIKNIKLTGNTLSIGESVTVGNNRTIERVETDYRKPYELHYKLHGHAIAHVKRFHNGIIQVQIEDCGYVTSTTRNALNDLFNVLGLRVGVSIAGGKLTATSTDSFGHDIKTIESGQALNFNDFLNPLPQ